MAGLSWKVSDCEYDVLTMLYSIFDCDRNVRNIRGVIFTTLRLLQTADTLVVLVFYQSCQIIVPGITRRLLLWLSS